MALPFDITQVFNFGSKVIDKIWPDPIERDKAKLRLMELQQTGELAILAAETDLAKGQLEINKVEAQSTDKFVTRWRPFIGWVCGFGFVYHVIIQPVVLFVCALKGIEVKVPEFDTYLMVTTLGGLLGLGTMRTVEKVKGVKK